MMYFLNVEKSPPPPPPQIFRTDRQKKMRTEIQMRCFQKQLKDVNEESMNNN